MGGGQAAAGRSKHVALPLARVRSPARSRLPCARVHSGRPALCAGPWPAGLPADEDEGFKAALNIDTSVAKLGFYGPGGAKLWARSGVESLHLWEWQAACNDEATGGPGRREGGGGVGKRGSGGAKVRTLL